MLQVLRVGIARGDHDDVVGVEQSVLAKQGYRMIG